MKALLPLAAVPGWLGLTMLLADVLLPGAGGAAARVALLVQYAGAALVCALTASPRGRTP